MLSLSVPGQCVVLEDLATMNPSAVVRDYVKQLSDSVNGDPSLLRQIGSLSLDGDAAPARPRVRRASLLPSYPTLPAACLQAPQAPHVRLGRAAFDTANTAGGGGPISKGSPTRRPRQPAGLQRRSTRPL
jgi:hypothetical protein